MSISFHFQSEFNPYFLAISEYKIGTIYRVSKVDINVPPITAIANGTFASVPALVAIAVGNNPKIVVPAVINTGRNLSVAPLTIASLLALILGSAESAGMIMVDEALEINP